MNSGRPLRIQLWSCHYAPEPTGNAPVTTLWAKLLRERGHHVDVIAAHPHYPEAVWDRRLLPYRENRDGVSVLRLPVWTGRRSVSGRFLKEISLVAAQFAMTPVLRRPDVAVVASPSFPHVLPAIVTHWLRRTPWVLWLQDILPDGAVSTGMVEDGLALRLLRLLELAAYRRASRIVIVSPSFRQNLERKGVPAGKLHLLLNPATRVPVRDRAAREVEYPAVVFSMGNIGFTQALAQFVRAFEASDAMKGRARLVIAGTGAAIGEVRREILSDRVEMLGIVDDARLEQELDRATLAFVSQHYEGAEFNVPSKLMNYMAYGLPVIAAVRPGSAAAAIIEESRGGWVVDSSRPEDFPTKVHEVLAMSTQELAARGAAGRAYYERHFDPQAWAAEFEALLQGLYSAPGHRLHRE